MSVTLVYDDSPLSLSLKDNSVWGYCGIPMYTLSMSILPYVYIKQLIHMIHVFTVGTMSNSYNEVCHIMLRRQHHVDVTIKLMIWGNMWQYYM